MQLSEMHIVTSVYIVPSFIQMRNKKSEGKIQEL